MEKSRAGLMQSLDLTEGPEISSFIKLRVERADGKRSALLAAFLPPPPPPPTIARRNILFVADGNESFAKCKLMELSIL